MSFDQWAVVVVPFPFTDRDTHKRRPALVLSNQGEFGAQTGHSVMAMITSATHARWPLDVVLTDRETAGLPAPSLARMKLFTLDDRLVLRQLGILSQNDRAAVAHALSRLLSFSR
jgi:mRNA interferase MazF